MLAAIGPVGELMLLSESGAPQTLAHPEQPLAGNERRPFAYAWPTWTADGAALLVSTLESGAESGPPAQLLRMERGGASTALFRSSEGNALLGPGMP